MTDREPPNRHPQEFDAFEDYRSARQARVDWLLSRRRAQPEVVEVERIKEVVREVPVDRIVWMEVADLEQEARIAELEAELAALRGKAASVPEALQKFRVEGETDAALRKRLKQMIFDLHSRREAARQGIGTFTDEDYDFLRFLESQDWLGS